MAAQTSAGHVYWCEPAAAGEPLLGTARSDSMTLFQLPELIGNLDSCGKPRTLRMLQELSEWQGVRMTKELVELLEAAKRIAVTPEQKEEQRRSFAFGNTNIENPRVTRDTVDREAEALKGN